MKPRDVPRSRNVVVLWRTFRAYRWQLLTLVVLGIVGAALDGVGVNAFIPLVSFYLSASEPTDFISHAIGALFGFFHIPFLFRYLLAFIVVLFILRAIATTVFGYIRGRISADFLGKESGSMLAHLLHATWPFLLKQKIGATQTTLVRDIQQSGNILVVLGQAIQSFTGFLIYALIAFNISPVITIATLIAGAALLLVVRPLMERTQAMGNLLTVAEKGYAHFLSEHIIGMKSVKAGGVEDDAIRAGSSLLATIRRLSIRRALIRSLSGSLFQPFSLIFVILLFLLTYKLPTFSLISFAASLYLIQKIFTYLESGQGALHTIRESIPYAESLESLKRTLEAHREKVAEGTDPFIFTREIRFRDVSFSHGSKEILSRVNFAIPRGATIGLVGPSGAGKTSVADLLLRLFVPEQGEVLVDGNPAGHVSLDAWRNSIGYVGQDVFLLNTSIRENVRFYRTSISDEMVRAALRQANILDFVDGLPEGMDAVTGDRGTMLSGGQRQRIALARALAGNPQLLVLDEATSALDHESEKLIHESIRALRGKVTVLIIAHRPSTVADVDSILVLDEGRIVEQGTPQELLANVHSYFYSMQKA